MVGDDVVLQPVMTNPAAQSATEKQAEVVRLQLTGYMYKIL
jgi:hypothetical protein